MPWKETCAVDQRVAYRRSLEPSGRSRRSLVGMGSVGEPCHGWTCMRQMVHALVDH